MEVFSSAFIGRGANTPFMTQVCALNVSGVSVHLCVSARGRAQVCKWVGVWVCARGRELQILEPRNPH
jgi:hypothetical protein